MCSLVSSNSECTSGRGFVAAAVLTRGVFLVVFVRPLLLPATGVPPITKFEPGAVWCSDHVGQAGVRLIVPDHRTGLTIHTRRKNAMTAIFFESPSELRKWFEKNHTKASELMVGFHRKGTGRPTLTWPESVAEALCFGWIDGVRRRIDNESYTIRFTPRRPGSSWSAINVRMIGELESAGRMRPAGRAAFERRKDARSPGYSYERRDGNFDEARLKAFMKNKAAWLFFEAQPPGYRRTLAWWVMSAKQEDTRDRRLAKLVESSAAGQRMT
jgi:uncharacterized protein YdeI (YjbR/CyaY-like superfamily)